MLLNLLCNIINSHKIPTMEKKEFVPAESELDEYYLERLKTAIWVVNNGAPDVEKYSLVWATLVGNVYYKCAINRKFKKSSKPDELVKSDLREKLK